ncbi:MAG: methyl-accepting chemotaxis protein [Succinatimonas sp.]|nr:methyl-accepting chemotaxis protein [Succinatimonas sp.]MDD6754755.1 methyl-accepting chemotaxis protein [Succinatimonas sp.]MDY6246586.1 methyl-accepting chemotaxis protein [Succinivibrio sp.]
MKLILGFGILNILIIVTSGFAVINTSKNIDASYNVERILGKSYTRVMNTQRALDKANDVIVSYLNGKATHDHNEAFIADSVGKIEEIAKVSSVMNENIIGDLPSSEHYKNNILTVKKQASVLVAEYKQKVVPLVAANKLSEALDVYIYEVLPITNNCLELYQKLIDEQVTLSTELTRANTSKGPMYTAIILAVISVIIAFLISSGISGYIHRNFSLLVNYIGRMEKGDFNFIIDNTLEDEFGKVFNSAAQMRLKLGESLADVVKSYRAFDERLSGIHSKISSVAEAIADAESRSVTVSAASDEMVSTTSDIAKNCENAATNANDTQNITEHGVTEVEGVIDAIRNQAEKTKKDAQLISTLVDQTNKIGTIVQTIEDIASQTNLLALNAAIEAARAGEAGKGFAVVADEVRALASRSSSSTQEITKMVSQIQSDANSANESMTNTLGEMKDLAERASGVTDILNDINSHVDNVNSQIGQIATAAQQQTTATSEISNNMQGVSTLTRQSANSSQDSNDEIEQLRVAAKDLLEKLAVFKLEGI